MRHKTENMCICYFISSLQSKVFCPFFCLWSAVSNLLSVVFNFMAATKNEVKIIKTGLNLDLARINI